MNESNLVKFFGNSPFIKIVDALIDNIGSELSKKQIQELAGISKASLFQNWEKVECSGITKQTRAFGKTKLYTLNTESQTVKNLLRMEVSLIEQTMPKQDCIKRPALATAKC